MQKHPKTGKAETMSYGHRYKDGSLRVDIPLSDLRESRFWLGHREKRAHFCLPADALYNVN